MANSLRKRGFVRLSFCGLILFAACAAGTAQTKDVVTYHNDLRRSGLNSKEAILTTRNVKSSTFGKLFVFPVDGKIDAQPLYLSTLSISGNGTHNVIYTVTENDSVYAFDADTGTSLWHQSLLPSGESPSGDHGCGQISPQIGITSTPVIDRASGPNGTIYVVAMSRNSSNNYFQRIHALDVTTGQEEFAGPVAVQAQYPKKNGSVTFDPTQYAERQGLLLLNHVIHTAWTSHCDQNPYTGWIIGYNESTLAQTSVLNVTPNGSEGSIWQSGAGMASDGSNIYFLDANGTFDTQLDKRGFPILGDFGNGIVKVATSKTGKLFVADYFNMFNTVTESNMDEDLGSGGALLLPPMIDANGTTRRLAMAAGKDTNIYIVDRANMGKFNPNSNHIYQQIDNALSGGIWSMPAYFNGSVYYGSVGNNLLQFQFSQARLATAPVSKSANTFGYPGSTPSVSANGTTNGIVWAIEHGGPDVLHAFDATNLANELYNSNQASNARDQFGNASHFGTPTIINGKVYVGTDNGVVVFGLLGGEGASTGHRNPSQIPLRCCTSGVNSRVKSVRDAVEP
jgi:outer membrane protein assembly factor BamB